MWDIALSTMWSFGLFNHLKEFFSAAQTLGFRQFELNHQVNSQMLNGLENRYHYLEIPLPHEMDMLLELADDGRLGFWYDVGHAQVFDRLGFYSHETWLRRYAPRMLGAHLHDVRGLQDHLAAGLGEVDWEMVAAYLPEEVLRVCEVRGHNTPDQMTSAMQFLTHKGLVKTI